MTIAVSFRSAGHLSLEQQGPVFLREADRSAGSQRDRPTRRRRL